MKGRRLARELTLQMLFYSDVSSYNSITNLEFFYKIFLVEKKTEKFFKRLFSGVVSNRRKIDNIIGMHSKNWKLNRMFSVDLNILRFSIFEMLYCNDIPLKASINEAVIIGKKYGSKNSGAFINAVLNSIYVSIHKN